MIRTPDGADRRERPVLLTVSGIVAPDVAAQIAAGRRPRADYLELADAFDADIVDYERAAASLGWVGRALRMVAGPDITLAVACFVERKRRRVIVTDSERIGLLLALGLSLAGRRGVRHITIAHRISTPSKVLMHRIPRLRRGIDRLVVYASSQQRFAVDRLRYPPEAVVLTPFMVDTEFWRFDAATPTAPRGRAMICAVGQELRDYRTLAAATEGLGVDVVVAAASPWSKRPDDTTTFAQPDNFEVVRIDQFDLRQLYADADLTVIPIVETDFQAGITAILESMSMQRTVICTRTEGQTDTLVDGETGRYVAPGDVQDLRDAISSLLARPDEAARLGANARRWAIEQAALDVYVARLTSVVEDVMTMDEQS